MNNLKAVLTLLKSDKSKDRQQGITSLREVFGRSSVIENLDENGDGRAWLVVFQALYTAVVNERATVLKKSSASTTATAERRLKDAAIAVRWLTEKSVSRWNKKVAKSLIKHLLQMMVYNGKLFGPIALDYAKALRDICSYPPHLDHLMSDDSQWIPILSFSFAVVLGDDLRTDIEDEPEGMSEAEVDSVLSSEDASSPRKRRRLDISDRKRSKYIQPRTASPEQIEFVGIIATILKSTHIQLSSPEHPILGRAVLNRLTRFFKLYPVETSAHIDAIVAVNAALDCLALNNKYAVMEFGVEMWDRLLALWSSKSKQMKDYVLISLKILFPYVTHADAQFDRADGIGRLLRLLQTDHESRWGYEELSIDILRLEVSLDDITEPFVAHTFRYGFNFSSGQAASWAVLELLADANKELYSLHESTYSIMADRESANSKRMKFESPIQLLLQTLRRSAISHGNAYAFQNILFIIDRHWTSFHSELQLDIMDTLLQFVTSDRPMIQIWIFCCFAAIAYADSLPDAKNEAIQWDGVWSHAMRRTNVPTVSRAACHAAHTMLLFEKLPINRLWGEIETMAQDLTVQGPIAPLDSVCAFLACCIKISRQDTRLYRIHLDEMVLSWLTENWIAWNGIVKFVSGHDRGRLEQQTVQDILFLLQTVCGLVDEGHLLCSIPISPHPITDLLRSQLEISQIKEFLLNAQFLSPGRALSLTSRAQSIGVQQLFKRTDDLAQPDPRERRVCAFLLKTLDSIILIWEDYATNSLHPQAENARRSLDAAMLALSFDACLTMNGTRGNHRLLSAACKLILLINPFILNAGWSADEVITILQSLSVITFDTLSDASALKREAFIRPGAFTGVKGVNVRMEKGHDDFKRVQSDFRLRLQRTIWQNSVVQESLFAITDTLKRLLKAFAKGLSISQAKQTGIIADDDGDEFGPIQSTSETSAVSGINANEKTLFHGLVQICIQILSRAVVLQSPGRNRSNDKELIDLLCECENDEIFQALLDPFLLCVHRRDLYITPSSLDHLLTRIEGPLMSYKHGHSHRMHGLSIKLLDATSHIWLQKHSLIPDLGSKVRALFQWLASSLKEGKLRSWSTRDAFLNLCNNYLALDTHQKFLEGAEDEELDKNDLPDSILPLLTKDEDIRVRFNAALACSQLFSTGYIQDKDAMAVYAHIRGQLCVILSDYEHMLTRFICLANIMIASSAVRRGPYWHLLETCLYSQNYVPHVESVLTVAADRMGLKHFSELFEAYASQIAYSIRISQQDFFRFPPHLLGYKDRKECAEATFTAFSPANLLAGSEEGTEHNAFARHCNLIGKSVSEGLKTCFADIAGYQIVFWMDEEICSERSSMDEDSINEADPDSRLLAVLQGRFSSLETPDYLKKLLEQHVDGVLCAILRTNGIMDYLKEGEIVKALEGLDKSDRIVRAFRSLMKFRGRGEFETHSPNLPSFRTPVVLSSLMWFTTRVNISTTPATTYHILHRFFADIARCPLVNEQLRLLTCLCIWVSITYSQFKNHTLLRVLINGATSLMSQINLASVAQGILDWSFIHLREVQYDSPHLVETLIHICVVYRDFINAEDDAVKNMGFCLKGWLEDQMCLLSEVSCLRRRVAIALAAWPDELSERQNSIMEDLSCSELSYILDDPYLLSHKFKIARRLKTVIKDLPYEKDQFAKHDFWRLKECIPMSRLLDEESDAFTGLLLHNSGYIRSHPIDHLFGRSIGSRHQKLVMQKDDKGRRNTGASSKRPIIMSLLDMLVEQSLEIVQIAHHTLRRLSGIELLDTPEYGSWPTEYRGDISFLKFCSISDDINIQNQDLNDLLQLQLGNGSSDFTTWISSMSTFLCNVLGSEDPFFACLTDMIRNNTSFSEQIFPVLVHALLHRSIGKGSSRSKPSTRDILSLYVQKLLSSESVDVHCHRSLVNLILHLRNYNLEDSDFLAYNKWLDLDFLLLSTSALQCGAYTTSLLFLEIAMDPDTPGEVDEGVSERILFDIYSHIDEPDGFYGIRTHDLRGFLLRRFQHERQYDKAFQFHGADFEADERSAKGLGGVLKSLQSFGFNKLAMSTLQTHGGDEIQSNNYLSSTHQLGWRTETWDLPQPSGNENPGSSLYTALRAVHRDRDANAIGSIISRAIFDELQRLRDLGNENLDEIRQVTQTLMSLAQIRLWMSNPIQNDLSTGSVDVNDPRWTFFHHINQDFDFMDLESIIATRVSLLRSARQREQREQIGILQSDLTRNLINLERRCLVQLSEAAREAKQPQIALNSIVRALRLEPEPSPEVSQEFANVLWLQNEQKYAVEFLRRELENRTINRLSRISNRDKVQKALTLAKLGEWTSTACLEKPDFIHAHYFKPAIDLLLDDQIDEVKMDNVRASIFHKCALFAEQQYHAIVRSPDIVRLKVYAERKKQELKEREETIRRTQSNSSKWMELTQHQRRAKALYEQDTTQFLEVTRARDTFLFQSVQLLSLCLEASDAYDSDATIRLCSLWFANFTTDAVNSSIPSAISKVPSRKFVFLAHQLSARLSVSESSKISQNQLCLQQLLLRMCGEHPFHSLYQVYSLQSSGLKAMSSTRRQSSSTIIENSSQIERATAAMNIFDQLKSIPASADKARDLQILCDAYLEWAKFPIKSDKQFSEKKKRKEAFQIPSHLNIRKIANLKVPVTTVHTPLDATMQYDDCIWINGYAAQFDTAGGVNLPKISFCRGSDGRVYRQLFKGEGDDDLRQDAVMEQVFELCNQVLFRDLDTRKRELSIRSYKVVPLAPQAGLLEYVGNTVPMQAWLNSAHARYHPSDLVLKDCTHRMAAIRKESNGDKDALVKCFRAIRQKFHPVLRHYFTERHKVPQAWFEMRLRYSRSVAVSSIIGHILGLGDRHISNILLDNGTGEVVHIDLGIAFEQGKLLPVSERVPFRLTADLVDGFGMSGTEGVFRRCAEETLRVLRDDSDVIKTVLEVFKHDPLHSWTASAVKIRKAQGESAHPFQESDRLGIGIDMDSGMEDEAADRALNGVARKLNKALSVEYTVNELIAEATDVTNLALMFAGWNPFC